MEVKDMADGSEKTSVIWTDKKHILGMPISFTRYTLDRERLTIRKGLFTTTVDELLLYRILDLKMTATLGQKLFGVGTVHIYSADRTDKHLDLVNIKRPDEVRRRLSRLVEAVREEKCLTGRELYGSAGLDGLAEMGDVPIMDNFED